MLMNPLNMRGPDFLVFYFIVGVLTLLFIRKRIKHQESQWVLPKLNLTDPYEIALLRGGENEALRVAALSLIDRGLIEVIGDTIKTKNKSALNNVRRSIEIAMLTKFSSASVAHNMYDDASLKAACLNYRTSLGQKCLLADKSVYESRRPMLWLGLFILGGLAGAKLLVAFQRGRQNIFFLVIMAVVFLFFLLKYYTEERTGLGDRVLTDLKALFNGLKDRRMTIRPGGATNEAALLAAVFGVSALPAVYFPYIAKLFPKAATNPYSSTSSSCGSSCGSSSGSSCGSSCGGGGGGGGGCGGCGGD